MKQIIIILLFFFLAINVKVTNAQTNSSHKKINQKTTKNVKQKKN